MAWGNALKIAPMPRVNRTAQTNTPLATPAAVSTPALRPEPRDTDDTAIMFGPGVTWARKTPTIRGRNSSTGGSPARMSGTAFFAFRVPMTQGQCLHCEEP